MKLLTVRGVFVSVLLVTSCFRAADAGMPANGGPFGVGLIVGAPTGVTGKLYLDRVSAIDGGVGFRSDDLLVYADYLIHPEVFRIDYGDMPFYLGGGGRIHFKNDQHEETVVGLRFVTGLAYQFPYHPFEAFIEVAPSLRLAPSVGGDMDAGIGVRYFFRTTRR